MPLTIPPFSQYQAPLFPLRGLWNAKPAEGDKFIAAEIDWGTYPPGQAVQFSLSGNSPVALSQIVALSVDNARCGADVQFIFADSGFVLEVPSHCQGVFPVFTNGLMFYAAAIGAGASDVTVVNVHNSMPPPIAMQPSERQNTASVTGISVTSNHTQVLIPPPVSGTLVSASIAITGASTTIGQCGLTLQDGLNNALWGTFLEFPVGQYGQQQSMPAGSQVRFYQGVSLVVYGSSGITAGSVTANLYYTVP